MVTNISQELVRKTVDMYPTYYSIKQKGGMMTLTPFPQNQVGRRGSLYKCLIGILVNSFNLDKQKKGALALPTLPGECGGGGALPT